MSQFSLVIITRDVGALQKSTANADCSSLAAHSTHVWIIHTVCMLIQYMYIYIYTYRKQSPWRESQCGICPHDHSMKPLSIPSSSQSTLQSNQQTQLAIRCYLPSLLHFQEAATRQSRTLTWCWQEGKRSQGDEKQTLKKYHSAATKCNSVLYLQKHTLFFWGSDTLWFLYYIDFKGNGPFT